MALARFLQVSDLHLGRPFGWLPPEKRDLRRRSQRRVLEGVVREAIERGVDAILIPGDLFDLEGVDADTLAFALGVFNTTGCPPVFIAPGNHDPFSTTSAYWDRRLLAARGSAWPAHVHVFTSAQWTSVPLPEHPHVRIWGRCFTARIESLERPLAREAMASITPAAASGFDVAVFHGSREEQCPPGQKITAPFSDQEVLNAPFAYLAAGHYHAGSRVVASEGSSAGVRLAYAGSAAALDVSENGLHGALEVRIEYGYRLPWVEVEFVQLDPHRVFDLTVDVTSAPSAEQVDRRVQKALENAGVGEEDMVRVRLRGRLARGVRIARSPELESRVFHLRIDPRLVRPEYDLDVYRREAAATTEDRFACTLLDLLDREDDPVQRGLIESALYYGLDAFRLREVVPAYEELGE
ncbi:MAG TPA: metallophosphoesterase [Candidatus Limnocylindria bacterium]|nr:metallophosphoesterase [Candidatus Limnocylindria bacterium]